METTARSSSPAAAAAAPAPASFPQFARLPAELRRKIWRRALPRRAVHLRLKMDMNAWNWATEGDWWTHYLVAADPFPVASPDRALYHGGGGGGGDDDEGPALLRVNAEARAEALHAYRRRLALDPATLRRCLGTAAGGRDGDDDDDGPASSAPGKDAPGGSQRRATQHLLTRMCAPSGAPRFHAGRDVLVWAGVRRWCGAGSTVTAETTCALFETACRAARHVVVEYDARLDRPLRALARAVAAPGAPLRSLTLQTAAPELTRAERYWRGDFRVVAAPRRPVAVLRPRPDAAATTTPAPEAEEEEEKERDEAGREAAALLRRHRVVFLPAAAPPAVPEGGGFAVLAVVTPAQLAAVARRCCPASMAVFMDSALAHTFVGSLTAAQRKGEGARHPEAVTAPSPAMMPSFHGFCDPDYGLP